VSRPRETTRHRAQLRDAKALIRRNYRDPDLSLAGSAAELRISSRQLQRLFRQQGEESFRSYLLRVRMERAAVLLSRERNPLPVRLVAKRVGYRQPSGLRQAFVRFHGYNPSAIQPATPEYLGTTEFPPPDRLG
jgi:two-component system response regulator YesN